MDRGTVILEETTPVWIDMDGYVSSCDKDDIKQCFFIKCVCSNSFLLEDPNDACRIPQNRITKPSEPPTEAVRALCFPLICHLFS